MSTILKVSKWILILFIWLWEKKSYKNMFFAPSEQNGLKSETKTVETIIKQMRKTAFSPVHAALNLKKMTRENQNCSRRSSDVLTCCACVVKLVAATIVKD